MGRMLVKDPDRESLRSIVLVEPDEILPDHLQAAVPKLRKRGWIKTIEHSDGNYIMLTERGRTIALEVFKIHD